MNHVKRAVWNSRSVRRARVSARRELRPLGRAVGRIRRVLRDVEEDPMSAALGAHPGYPGVSVQRALRELSWSSTQEINAVLRMRVGPKQTHAFRLPTFEE